MKYFLFETGCKLNQALMNRLAGEHDANSWERTEKAEDADKILMASCIVTKKAEADFMRVFNRFRKLYPEKKIEITGCFNKEFLKETEVRFIDQSEILKIENPTSYRTRPEVVIQTGCNNFCSYCIVPYKRGREESRRVKEILSDTEKYIKAGKNEIVLTGVHIGKYDSDSMNLSLLLKEIKKTGIKRIRLSSLDINEIKNDLIEEIKKDKITARFVHLSLQHTEENVLAGMKRKADRNKIFETVKMLQEIEEMRFGADIIYNFPLETNIDFENLLKSLEELPITHFHLFAFSPRIGTLASYFEESGCDKEKKYMLLKELAERKKKEYLLSLTGKQNEIIIERIKDGIAYGKSSNYVNCAVEENSGFKKGDMIGIVFDEQRDNVMRCHLS